MEKHNLEEYFNRRVSKHSEFIDKNELWDDLGLERKKKRKGLFWLWIGLLLISVTVGGSLLINNFTQEQIAKNVDERNVIANTANHIDNRIGSVESNIDNYKSEKIVTEGNSTLNENLNPENTVILRNNSSRNKSLKTQDLKSNRTSESKLQSKVNLAVGINLDTQFKVAEITEPFKDELNDKKSEVTTDILRKYDREALGGIENRINIETQDIVPQNLELIENAGRSENEKVKTTNEGIDFDSIVLNEKNKEDSPVKSEVELFADVDDLKRTPIEEERPILKDETKDPLPYVSETVAAKIFPWMFGIYGDIANIDRTLNSITTRFDTLSNIRDASEKTLERVGFGAYLKYRTTSGFYAKLGINYTSLNTELKARILSREIETVDNFPLTIILQENGDTLKSNFGTLIQDSIVEQKLTIYTSHKLIDIPLSIGYVHDFGKWSLFAELRPSFSISHSYRGSVFNGKELVDGNRYVDASMKLSLGGAVGFSYELNDDFNMWIQPYFKKTFNSYIHESSGLRENYSFIGIRIGTEIQF